MEEKNKVIIIDELEYSYTISKKENDEGISIILKEVKPEKYIAFKYEASPDKIKNEIKALRICENISEMIDTLKEIFILGQITVEKKEEKYFMDLQVLGYGKIEKYEIELEKFQISLVDEMNKLLLKIKILQSDIKEVKEELNNIKNQSETKMTLNKEDKKKIIKEIKEEISINEYIKEIIKSKEIKDILFKEFEEKLSNMYINKEEEKLLIQNSEQSMNKIIDDKSSTKVDENIFNENINKIKEDINSYVKDINELKKNIENKDNIRTEINKTIKENGIINNLSKQMDMVNNFINSNNKDNYIFLKIKINNFDINKDIIIINQSTIYGLHKNFDIDDIDVEIWSNNKPINYSINFKLSNFQKEKNIGNNSNLNENEKSQKLYNDLLNNYSFYFNFRFAGIYLIKIAFKKPISSCAGMFYECKNIFDIDLSNFDCSKVISCESMFFECDHLIKINLGKLNFSLVKNFRLMFAGCRNLLDLDVTNFSTRQSNSFQGMFCDCNKLKYIDVSRFDAFRCQNINGMFENCCEINEIDMINWDMSHLKSDNENNMNPIDALFFGCSKLKKIKISGNIKEEEAIKNAGNIFYNVPQVGTFITNKNIKCNIPLDGLPKLWVISKE